MDCWTSDIMQDLDVKRPAVAGGPSSSGRAVIQDERLVRLLDYWLDLRRSSSVPDRAAFDPSPVADLLPYFWIVKREPDSGRYRFRLAGEELRTLLGRPMRGHYMDDVFGPNCGPLSKAMDETLAGPTVHHMAGPMYRNGRVMIHAERLALPMSDAGMVDTVFGATVFDWPQRGMRAGFQFTATWGPTVIPVSALAA